MSLFSYLLKAGSLKNINHPAFPESAQQKEDPMQDEPKISLKLELTREEELVLEVCLRLVASNMLNSHEETQMDFKAIFTNVMKGHFKDQNIRTLLDEQVLKITLNPDSKEES